MRSFVGTFFSIKASLYNGVPVTSVSTDAHEPRHCKASRHDRCFHSGPRQKDARQALRVLAGRRLRSSDPRHLSADAVQQCVDACPHAVRYARSLFLISLFVYLQTVCAGYCKCSRRWNRTAGYPGGNWLWRAKRTEACCEFFAVRCIWILLLQSASLLNSEC
jgi:hypothetical protein